MQSSLRKIETMKKTEYKVPANNRAPDPGKRRGLGAPSEGGGVPWKLRGARGQGGTGEAHRRLSVRFAISRLAVGKGQIA